jgi:fructan beta-fructosidase
MSCWPYANHTPTQSWRSAMSMPQELTLKPTNEGLRLHHAFIRELDAAHATTQSLADKTYTASASLLKTEWEAAARLTMNVALDDNSSVSLTPLQGTQLILTNQNGALTLRCQRFAARGDETYEQQFPHDYTLALGANRTVSLDLLLDRSSVELLVDDGRYAVTNLAFPEQGPNHLFSAEVTTGAVSINNAHWHILALPQT